MRTLDDLADFNFEIKYKAERDNIPADTMSRMLVKPCDDVEAKKDLLPVGLEVVQIIEGRADSMVESLYIVLKEHAQLYKLSVARPHNSEQLREILVTELVNNSEKYFDQLSKNKT